MNVHRFPEFKSPSSGYHCACLPGGQERVLNPGVPLQSQQVGRWGGVGRVCVWGLSDGGVRKPGFPPGHCVPGCLTDVLKRPSPSSSGVGGRLPSAAGALPLSGAFLQSSF